MSLSLSPSLLLRSLRISARPLTTTSSSSHFSLSPSFNLPVLEESPAAKQARERIEKPPGWRSAKKFEKRERKEAEKKNRLTTVTYDPTDSYWHTHLPPPLPKSAYDLLTPESRALHLACRTAFMNHQRSLYNSTVPFMKMEEWEALTEEEKSIRKQLHHEKRVALFALLPKREEETMWAAVTQKERKKVRKEKRDKKQEEFQERLRKREEKEKGGQVVVGEVVSEEEVVVVEVRESELDETTKEGGDESEGEVKVDADTEATKAEVEEEIENPHGAGIPLEARRGRKRR